MRIAQVSLRRSAIFVPRQHQIHLRHFFQNEIGKRRAVRVIGGAHLHAQADALVVLFCEIENQLQVFRQLEASGTRLDFSPGGTNVELLPEREFDQVFDGPRGVVGLDFVRAHVGGDVGDQTLAVIRDGISPRASATGSAVRSPTTCCRSTSSSIWSTCMVTPRWRRNYGEAPSMPRKAMPSLPSCWRMPPGKCRPG